MPNYDGQAQASNLLCMSSGLKFVTCRLSVFVPFSPLPFVCTSPLSLFHNFAFSSVSLSFFFIFIFILSSHTPYFLSVLRFDLSLVYLPLRLILTLTATFASAIPSLPSFRELAPSPNPATQQKNRRNGIRKKQTYILYETARPDCTNAAVALPLQTARSAAARRPQEQKPPAQDT